MVGKVKRAFATNEEYNENDVNLAERLFDLYGRRWGVETSYRVKKHSYLPKTTSKNYLIRLFYFMFSALLYNLWILADILYLACSFWSSERGPSCRLQVIWDNTLHYFWEEDNKYVIWHIIHLNRG